MSKKPTPMRLDKDLMTDIKSFAKEDHRTTTGMVEFILFKYRDNRKLKTNFMMNVINYALNISPLWMPQKPNINTCNDDEFNKYFALSKLHEELIKAQESYYE